LQLSVLITEGVDAPVQLVVHVLYPQVMPMLLQVFGEFEQFNVQTPVSEQMMIKPLHSELAPGPQFTVQVKSSGQNRSELAHELGPVQFNWQSKSGGQTIDPA
jgi:hypothetical protein